MGNAAACVETMRLGEYYLFDAKDYALGPVAVLSAVEYGQRYADARATGDPKRMFADPEQHSTFSKGEMDAYADYLRAEDNRLAELADGACLIAYENRRNLQAVVASAPAAVPAT